MVIALLSFVEQVSSPLPDLPETLKYRQDTLRTLSPSPPKEARPNTPPTRAHTKGATVPTEETNVYGNLTLTLLKVAQGFSQ